MSSDAEADSKASADGISSARLLLITGIVVGLYLVGRLVVTPAQTHPLSLVAVLPAGALLGALIARFAVWRRPATRGRARPTNSAANWSMVGLAGSGLILAQILPPRSLEWLALGFCGFGAAAVGHALVKERQRQRASPAR